MIGGGTSTIMGWSSLMDFSYERKHHEISCRLNYNNQLGNVVASQGFFIKNRQRYNDHFLDIAVLYGQTYRVKNWFMASLSAGMAYFKFTDKTLGSMYRNWGTYYDIRTETHEGGALALQGEVNFITGDSFGLGLTFFGNINGYKNMGGVTLSLIFGKLR